MKLFHKIFLCFVVIFGIAFQAAGVLLIDHVYENALEQERSMRCRSSNIISIFYSLFSTPGRTFCGHRKEIWRSGILSQRRSRSMTRRKIASIPICR